MLPLPTRPDQTILTIAGLLLAGACCLGLVQPVLFGVALAASVVAGMGFLAFCFPTSFCVGWLLITGMSLEMALHDLFGHDPVSHGPAGGGIYQFTILVAKGIEIGLSILAMMRFGARLDLLCPAWAFPAMMAAGLAHGLYPGMSPLDSLRSMIGSIAPFVFSFCRLPRYWAEAIIRATKWCPIVAIIACLPLAAAGLRPLFVDSGGARLAGLGHPAFLAGVCLPAIYACLIQLYRGGRSGDLVLLIANFIILVLTGARAPFAYAVVVTGLSLVSLRSGVFPLRHRLLLILGTLVLLPVLAVVAGELQDVRLFNVLLNETDNLSGRTLLWPMFEDAATQSPWFGWGVGAGNAVIPLDDRVFQVLHTSAAHNEYLRMEVEGGIVGEALLIILFAAWTFVRTRPLWPSDRRIMRLVLLAFAGHALTDNVLISTPACVLFAFVAAVFARGQPYQQAPANTLARFQACGVGNAAIKLE